MHIPGLVIKRGILMLTKEEFQQKIQEGVRILAVDCRVTPDSMEIRSPVEIRL